MKSKYVNVKIKIRIPERDIVTESGAAGGVTNNPSVKDGYDLSDETK